MDFDAKEQGIFRYEEGENNTKEEISPSVRVNENLGKRVFLVRMKDESFLLIYAGDESEVVKEISKVTNPRQTIITPLDTNLTFEFEPRKRPIQHIRDGILVDDSEIPKFNFLDICSPKDKSYTNVSISCTDWDKNKVVQLHAHFAILSRWKYFRNLLDRAKKFQKGKNRSSSQQHIDRFTVRTLKKSRKEHIEILLRYLYAPQELCEKWIPEYLFKHILEDTKSYLDLLRLARKVGVLGMYQSLSQLFINYRILRTFDLSLPVYTSDPSDPKYEEEKEHFEEDFYKKRFVKSVEQIVEIWKEIEGEKMNIIENFIAVYLLEHCIGNPDRVKLLPVEIRGYQCVKYYIQKNKVLMENGRRNFLPYLEKKRKKRKKRGGEHAISKKVKGEDDVDDKIKKNDSESDEFPFKLSICGDYNFNSFSKIKEKMYPEVHKIEKEVIQLYVDEEERDLRNKKAIDDVNNNDDDTKQQQEEREGEEEEEQKEDVIVKKFQRKRKQVGKKLRMAWLKDKEKSSFTIRGRNWQDTNPIIEEDDLFSENDQHKKLISKQMKSNRYLLSKEEYMDQSEDEESSDEEEEERKCNAKCGKLGTKICTRCRKVFYCSRECQVKDWNMHKKMCGKK